jgi:hypothetical protein
MSALTLEACLFTEAAQREFISAIAAALHELSVRVKDKPLIGLEGERQSKPGESNLQPAPLHSDVAETDTISVKLDRMAGYVQCVASVPPNPLLLTITVLMGMYLFPQSRVIISAATVPRISRMYFDGKNSKWKDFDSRMEESICGIRKEKQARTAIELVLHEQLMYTRINSTRE